MSAHALGHEHGRQLCDSLLAELDILYPGVARDEKEGSCGFHHDGSNRFAYLYHAKRNSGVKIYFRGDPDFPLENFPKNILVERRGKITGAWPREYPFFLTYSNSEQSDEVALFLSNFSYPMAIRKKGSRISQARPIEWPAEEVSPASTFPEGGVQRILVNRYERDPRARDACIEKDGTVCYICKFDFVTTYGPLMSGFIHVHHRKLLSKVGKDYRIDPLEDLRPICPNCHAVLHRREPPYDLDEVKELLKRGDGQTFGSS